EWFLTTALRYVVFEQVPHDRQGRTWAAFGVIVNTATLAGYVLGYLGERISVPGAPIASGVVAGACSIARLISLSTMSPGTSPAGEKVEA
ncbi:MAG TPA: hypothetical protein VHF06_28990, partial [Pseudonocardiaceae bacterium]|nr:hypothetical protein [Pseudonocardiaceae bacterium]